MRKNAVLQVVKATCAAIIFSLIFVLVFTIIIQAASLSSNVIKPVNQIFKVAAIAAGGLMFIRGEKGLIKGGIHGVCSVVFTYILFSLISGSFSASLYLLAEIAIGCAAGAVSGVIAVNLKKAG